MSFKKVIKKIRDRYCKFFALNGLMINGVGFWGLVLYFFGLLSSFIIPTILTILGLTMLVLAILMAILSE